MGIKERKERERQQFRDMVIEKSYELLRAEGLVGLSMRKLADLLEYSPTKLYREFENKRDILLLVGGDIVRRQNAVIATVSGDLEPEEYLRTVTRVVAEHYTREPSSADVIRAIRYPEQDNNIPEHFLESARLYRSALEACKFPALKEKRSMDRAQRLTQVLLHGSLSLLGRENSDSERETVVTLIDTGLATLMAGWRQPINV